MQRIVLHITCSTEAMDGRVLMNLHSMEKLQLSTPELPHLRFVVCLVHQQLIQNTRISGASLLCGDIELRIPNVGL